MSRLSSPPPRYDAHSYLQASSTSLRPYLQLPHIISLTWLAYPILSLIFVIFRLQLSSAESQTAVANAKDDLLTACQAAEQAATAAASMPRYLAIATNNQFADAANGTMNGAREALILALTCMEAIINFLISIYRSTFLCFLELVVTGGLDLLISAVQEITSFLQNTLNSIVSGLKNDANSLNSAIQSAVDAVNKVNPFGTIQAPQFNVSSLDALSNITIPTDFENTLIQLNSSLPTVSSIKNSIENLVDTPFEAVKADINNTFLGLTLDPTLLPVPEQNTVTFCSSLDTSSVDDLGNDLLEITKIGTIILIVVLFLLLAGHAALEWYKWRCLRQHLRHTREAWMADPTTYHASGANSAPSVTLSDHNLLMLQTDAQHPLLTRIAFTIASRLHLTPSQHIHLRWFLHYIFHPPALACFLIGFFGLLSVQIQLIAVGPLEAQYTAQAAASVQDLSTTIATQMNNSMYNQSAAYASGINVKVDSVQSTINNGLFGWVNGTTTTLNTTLNNFYTDVQNIVASVFNGTILETPAQDFVKCLIGSKVNDLEEALTFLNQNLNVDLPRVNETVLVLSPSTVNEITQPIATAAIGGGQNDSQGLIGRLVATYVDSLKQERLMFALFIALWGVVVLMGLAIVFWHSYARNWVEAYKKRKWRKEQRDGLEEFVTPYRDGASRAADSEKGLPDPPLRSFTPLPESRSHFTLDLLQPSNQAPPAPNHPLKSLDPAFEKSWDSFFREGEKDREQPQQPSTLNQAFSRPMKLIGLRRKKSEEAEEKSDDDKPKSVWFKPRTGLFAKKENTPPISEFVVNRPSFRVPPPQLSISVEQASAGTPKSLPVIDVTPSPNREQTSVISPVPPTLPWVRNVPPRKAAPQSSPPPPPRERTRNGSVPLDVGTTPREHGVLAMPLHNAFQEHPSSHQPVHLTLYSTFPPSHSGNLASQEKHQRSSTAPTPASPVLADPTSRHQSTRSISRLLTKSQPLPRSEAVDPFATPFDDDAAVASPAKTPTKRITNPFAGFAL